MEVIVFTVTEITIDKRVQEYCKLPYPAHPKGCPNWNKKEGCPPNAKLLNEIIEPPFIGVAVKFNLENWVEKLRRKHPNWSERQLRCCLYWQGKVRKVLKEFCRKLCKEDEVIIYAPEAKGTNLFVTCAKHGIKLERNPKKIVYKIAIIGKKKRIIGENLE